MSTSETPIQQSWAEAVMETVTAEAEQRRLIGMYEPDEMVTDLMHLGAEMLTIKRELAAERAAREKAQSALAGLQDTIASALRNVGRYGTGEELSHLTNPDMRPFVWYLSDECISKSQELTSLRAELEAAKRALTVCVNLLEIWSKWTPDYCSAHTNFEGLPEIIEVRAAIAGKEK